MSIRFRFTLLYNIILALTLAIFGLALYWIQANVTYNALKQDIVHTSETIGSDILRRIANPNDQPPREVFPPPGQNQNPPGDSPFQKLPEREVVRVLDAQGNLVASPFGLNEGPLPLSPEGLRTLQNQHDWWEVLEYQDQRMLVYSRPSIIDGKLVNILQVARPLTELERSLHSLATILTIASLLTILIAFGVGWIFSGMMLQPIHRLTQTAQAIGEERDFTRRVTYTGPQDEVGQLATTFNAMLAQLQDAYQKVAHSLEMQRNFVADVSHELRTPLTTLRGNLGLLQRQPPIPAEERADILSDMTDESDRLIRLVNDLLVLARADAGRSLSKEEVSLLPILNETCRQARQLDPQRNILLETADLTVLGDHDAIKQVLLIALDNSLKHSSGDVLIRAGKKGGWVELKVKDEGNGIPPEKLGHVFDRFYRGEPNSTLPGFGLGLPIAKSMMEGMGGEISLESAPGQGSELTLRFLS